jgi:hypothetical protein
MVIRTLSWNLARKGIFNHFLIGNYTFPGPLVIFQNGYLMGGDRPQETGGRRKNKNKAKGKTMPRKIVRVDIPTNPQELIALGLKLQAQDAALGAASPLKGIKDWANFAGLITTADTQQKQSDLLSEQAQTATESRDIALNHKGELRENTVRHFVVAARDVLLGQNKGNENVLGDFGYEVANSPSAAAQARKAAKAAAKPSAQK